MPQYSTSITEVSALGSFDTEVNKLLAQFRATTVDSGDNFTEFIAIAPTTLSDSTFSTILLDSGDGRISSGLKALELLSIMCDGATPTNLFLFDNVIYTGSVHEFKNSTDTALIKLVTDNLGMSYVVSQLEESITSTYTNKCLTIGKNVRNGKFYANSIKSSMIIQSKKLVNRYLGINNG